MTPEAQASRPRRALWRFADRFARLVARRVWELQPPRPRDEDRYAALARLRARYDLAAPDLSASEVRVFSQNGEDGVLAEIFARIGVAERYFVEFGAGTGEECNTRFLAQVLGWSGLLLEVDPERFAALERRYSARPDVRTVRAVVTPENVDDLLAGLPEPDVCSIDVDGQDYWIWEALTVCRPRVLVVEVNSDLPVARRLVEPKGRGPWDGRRPFGASIEAMTALGARKGYHLVHAEQTGVNAFFVREDLAGAFPGPVVARRSDRYLAGARGPEGDLSTFVEVPA